MDDNVLRGLCQKCEWPVTVTITSEQHFISHSLEANRGTHEIKPVWFLSSKQMRIVMHSKEIIEWEKYRSNIFKKRIMGKRKYYEAKMFVRGLIDLFLEENPFLVAKILKENNEKK